jgi:hypothetical protein
MAFYPESMLKSLDMIFQEMMEHDFAFRRYILTGWDLSMPKTNSVCVDITQTQDLHFYLNCPSRRKGKSGLCYSSWSYREWRSSVKSLFWSTRHKFRTASLILNYKTHIPNTQGFAPPRGLSEQSCPSAQRSCQLPPPSASQSGPRKGKSLGETAFSNRVVFYKSTRFPTPPTSFILHFTHVHTHTHTHTHTRSLSHKLFTTHSSDVSVAWFVLWQIQTPAVICLVITDFGSWNKWLETLVPK